ncbi:MAG: aminoacyl-tRNA deacylase [Ignavibacteria bacterium]|nr:aminoacyl-tRNA deacylase [Ignavibacteria bacterium]
MSKGNYPVTAAVRVLRGKGITFEPRFYTYEEHGGTRHSAAALGVPEHEVVKTLVMKTDRNEPLIVLMHGDRDVSTKQLARLLAVKTVEPCDEATAHRHTGYVFGGMSPFGTRRPMPVYVQKSIFDLPRIYINGGKRGFLVEIDPAALRTALELTEIDAAISPS